MTRSATQPSSNSDGVIAMLREPVLHLQVLLGLALLLGGGGIVYGVRHFIIQAFALGLLALHSGKTAAFLKEAPKFLVLLVLLSVALPLLQLLPLPPSIWQSLPGRDLVTQSVGLAGYDTEAWRPFSVDPIRTLLSFCATIAPATVIALGFGLSLQHKRRLVWTVLALALFILLLGFIQLASGNTAAMTQWITPDNDVLYATFSNRNSGGVFFVMVAVVAATLSVRGGMVQSLVLAGAVILLALGAVLTQSRTSMSLLAVLVGICAIRGFTYWRAQRTGAQAGGVSNLQLGGIVIVALALPLALFASAVSGGRAAESFERFSVIQQDRFERWDDATYAIDRYWPVGAGMGSFDEVFQIDESLEYLSPPRAGRAHNDYLEILIESGIVGPLLILGWIIWSVWALTRPGTPEERWLRLGGFAALGCILLQSIMDYPLRSQALITLAALWVVLLASPKGVRS